MDYFNAIRSLRPNAKFSIEGNNFHSIKWMEPPKWEGGDTIPTEDEVIEEAKRLEAEAKSKEYREKRELEYPDFREYLDAVVKGDQDQLQTYIDKCKAVKLKYPKE